MDFYTLNTPQLSPSFQVNMNNNASTSNHPPISFSNTVTNPQNTINVNNTSSVATGANTTPINTHVSFLRQNNSSGNVRNLTLGGNLSRNNNTARNLSAPHVSNVYNVPPPMPFLVAPPVNPHIVPPQNQQQMMNINQQATQQQQINQQQQQAQQKVTPLPTPQSSQAFNMTDFMTQTSQMMQTMMQSNQAALQFQAMGSREALKALTNSNIAARVDQMPDITGRVSAYEIKKFF